MTSDTPQKNSVLIIDDESANIIALTNILGSEYTVCAASDGPDGIEAAKEHLPDVILLDILMPDMDGYEVFSRLKGAEATRDIPVIFITGLAKAKSEEKGLSMGAVDYITKPFNPAVVQLRVRHQMQMQNQINLIKHLSVTDQLTGVPNKHNFNERLRMDWAYAQRSKSPFSILFIDVDNFKNFNDTYGHLNGDLAIQTVAKAIKSSLLRSIDFVARWGGEEFVVLLPVTDLNGALIVAEKILKNVEDTPIAFPDGKIRKVTVSIGVNTCMPGQTGGSVDEFIGKADKALYAAKKTGKNRVCKYDYETMASPETKRLKVIAEEERK